MEQAKPVWVAQIERQSDIMADEFIKIFSDRFARATKALPDDIEPVAAETVLGSIFLSRLGALLTNTIIQMKGPALDIETDLIKGIRAHFAGARVRRKPEIVQTPQGG